MNSLWEFSLCGSAPLEFLILTLNKIKYIKLRVGLNHHISMLSSGVYWQQPDNQTTTSPVQLHLTLPGTFLEIEHVRHSFQDTDLQFVNWCHFIIFLVSKIFFFFFYTGQVDPSRLEIPFPHLPCFLLMVLDGLLPCFQYVFLYSFRTFYHLLSHQALPPFSISSPFLFLAKMGVLLK